MYTCAIASHHPTRFKWKYKENNNGCKRLKKRLHDQFILLYEQGIRRFLVDGALGVGQWSGEILLKMKLEPEYEDIEVVVVLPYSGHDVRWDERSRERLAFLLKHCSEQITVGKLSGRDSFIQRNRYMVDHADCLLAVYDHQPEQDSEIAQTVSYAKKKNLSLIFIHPDTGLVSGTL